MSPSRERPLGCPEVKGANGSKDSTRTRPANSTGSGFATGSSPALIRLTRRAARPRASPAEITLRRPTVTRTDLPLCRVWTTYTFAPEAWNLMPNPGSSRSQNEVVPENRTGC